MVDHDLRDGRVIDQGLEGTQPENLVEERLHELFVVQPAQTERMGSYVLVGERCDQRAHAFAVGDVDLVRVPAHERFVDLGASLGKGRGGR